jgi:hypothetical protein
MQLYRAVRFFQRAQKGRGWQVYWQFQDNRIALVAEATSP